MRFRDSALVGLWVAMATIVSSSAQSAPLRFAATEMPKPDPCLPFITETRDWLNKHCADGVTFKYYTVKELEEAVKKREVDVVLSEAGTATLLRRDGARPMLTTVSRHLHSFPFKASYPDHSICPAGKKFFTRICDNVKKKN